MKMKQGRLGREIQTQIDFIALTAILKCCLSCALKEKKDFFVQRAIFSFGLMGFV